jgi:hypothetical protein
MSTVEEIEEAVRKLPAAEQLRLAQRLQDVLWDTWDLQIKQNEAAGCLDHLIAEVEEDIAAGRTTPLDEVLDNP